MAYELAFQPARLNAVWNEWEQQRIPAPSALRAVVEWALMLHQRLPGRLLDSFWRRLSFM